MYSSTDVARTKNTHIFYLCFDLIIVSSTCFDHPSVHPQEDLYMQFYGIFSSTHISSLIDVRMTSNTS